MRTVIDDVADLPPGKLVIDPVESNRDRYGRKGLANAARGQAAGEVVRSWLQRGTRYAKAFGTLSAPLLSSAARRTPKLPSSSTRRTTPRRRQRSRVSSGSLASTRWEWARWGNACASKSAATCTRLAN